MLGDGHGWKTQFKTSPAQEAAAASAVTAPFTYASPYFLLFQVPDMVSDVTQFCAEPNFRNGVSVALDVPSGLPKHMDDYISLGGMADDFISTNNDNVKK